ncbi:sulfite reduction-associated complex DsrMKJOP protein DsrM [Halorhodospira halochloris]|uniref:Sulfite reduction-associated complex DsrMKJOP protein DsrM n=1 Tax=Halorhodospira halochloris TaxID=1052 RepID=A0A0X8XA96_HALHR|nr:nitrate reductase [Halorhodospira halochloris]BAU58372.1 sulfite reduction-associated complex DsrMKJOP protein DsrM [Halorhodospira halochloris]
MLTVTFALLFYAATAVLVGGLVARLALYAETPAPLRIPTTPAPTTKSGVALRVASEVLVFYSLFRSNKWIWLLGWAMHIALLLVVLRHLRYFLEPVPQWVVWIQPLGIYAAYALIVALIGLWLRRVIIDRLRHISSVSDHLMLALLLAIALSGLAIKHLQPTDIVAVKEFFIGLIRFNWQPLPADALLLGHLSLVLLLMVIFPFSKLLHAPGVFFSPTRNQPDNPREQRHLAPWAAAIERQGNSASAASSNAATANGAARADSPKAPGNPGNPGGSDDQSSNAAPGNSGQPAQGRQS